MTVRAYQTGDEKKMDFQKAQSYMDAFIDQMDLEQIKDLTWTYEHEGSVIAMGGTIPIWENRAQAWMLLSNASSRHMLAIHKAVRNHLIKSPFTRIEATVDIGFKEGVRWMKMLGFELEGLMRAYRPDGKDMLLFARIRK